MANHRKEKLSKLFGEEIGRVFNRLSPKLFGGLFITVVEVVVTPDLGIAKIYLSFLNTKDKNASLKLVDEHNKEIRKALAQTSVKGLRKVPELHFYLDETMDRADRINDLLNNLD